MATDITNLQNELKAREDALAASKQALAATKPALDEARRNVAAVDAEIKKLSSTVGGVFKVGTPEYEARQALERKRDDVFTSQVRPAERAENAALSAAIDAKASVEAAKEAVNTGVPATLKAPLAAAPVVASDPKVDAQDKQVQDPVPPAVSVVPVSEPVQINVAAGEVTTQLNTESSTIIADPNADRPTGLAGLPINQPEVPNSGLVSSAVTDAQINASNTSQDPNPETTFGNLGSTQSQAVARQEAQVVAQRDWRLKLSLAPGATYLYKDPNIFHIGSTNILKPLAETDGVIFPYTPTISTSYNASYEGTELTHTNYKFYQYRNSHVGEVTITADFTAQDTHEANYLLAVIHFFKTVTKMFYGQDQNPPAGLPPPLCYLTGYGQYQFDQHPVAIQSFTYTLPNDVDYIRAGVYGQLGGQPVEQVKEKPEQSAFSKFISSIQRLKSAGLNTGASYATPNFTAAAISNPTYVPTKMQITLVCLPIISRFATATEFGLAKYSTGELSRGSINPNIGGIW